METKDIKPLEGFDWEAFENDGVSAADKAAQKAAYEGTLNNVNDNEVVDGTITAINDREAPAASSATLPTSRWVTP